jgi:peptidoglycan hydrolase-like protein with peptidoglycan-binding domain
VIQTFMRRFGLCLALAGVLPARPHADTPGLALVIGSDANASPAACAQVASAVADRLRQLGVTVQLLLHPSVVELRGALDDMAADQATRSPGSTVIYACASAVDDGRRLFVVPSAQDRYEPLQPQTQGVVVQALLNALSGSNGTLYADLNLPKDSSPSPFVGRVTDGLHLALAVARGGNPAAIGRRLADQSVRIDQDWQQIANALQAGADPAAMTLLPISAPPTAAVGTSTPPSAAPPPAPAAPPLPVAPMASSAPSDAIAVVPPAATPSAPLGSVERAAPLHTLPGRSADNDARPVIGRTARIQAALAHRHIYDGLIDGLMGPGTITAIRTFQGSLGDAPTGVLTGLEIVRLLNQW